MAWLETVVCSCKKKVDARFLRVLNAHQERDEFIFISNALQGKHQRILDYNNCLEAIDQTTIKAPVLNIKSVINRWNALKQNEINAKSELFIISDFQKASFQEEFYNEDKSFTTHLIPISSYPKANISIDTCYLESPNHTLGALEWLNFDASNASNDWEILEDDIDNGAGVGIL